jgi:hypothetical protein
VELEHNGSRFTVTIGFYPDGRPGEVFTHGIRSGSNLDALLADACVVVSCLIQHGVEPREIASSMGRLGNAEPASIIGAVIDLAAGVSKASKATEEANTLLANRCFIAPLACWRTGAIPMAIRRVRWLPSQRGGRSHSADQSHLPRWRFA